MHGMVCVLGVQPLVARAWYMRGLACMHLERYDDAIFSFNRCVQQDEEIGEAWANIGAIHYQRQDYGKSLTALKDALKHKPNNAKVLQNLVLVTIQLKKFSESCMYMSILVDIRDKSKQEMPMIVELQLICRGILELELPGEHLMQRFDSLLVKIEQAYSSDAEVWDIFCVFEYATGRPEKGLQSRFKQLRSLVLKPSWENSETHTEKVFSCLFVYLFSLHVWMWSYYCI